MARIVMAVCCLFLLGSVAHADEYRVEGTLMTGRWVVDIDSVLFEVGVLRKTIATPGWSGAPDESIPYTFPEEISGPPSQVIIWALLDSVLELMLPIPNPIMGFWYPLPAPPPPPMVSLEWYVGISGEEAPERSVTVFEVRPSVVRNRAVFHVSLPEPGNAGLEIYDASGTIVRRFEVRSRGTHTLTWDGTDMDGRAVAEGIYFCRLTTGDAATVRKVLLAR